MCFHGRYCSAVLPVEGQWVSTCELGGQCQKHHWHRHLPVWKGKLWKPPLLQAQPWPKKKKKDKFVPWDFDSESKLKVSNLTHKCKAKKGQLEEIISSSSGSVFICFFPVQQEQQKGLNSTLNSPRLLLQACKLFPLLNCSTTNLPVSLHQISSVVWWTRVAQEGCGETRQCLDHTKQIHAHSLNKESMVSKRHR